MEGRSPFEKVSLEDLKKAIDAWEEGLKRKMEELSLERTYYEQGSPYEEFLSGVIQGIHYALSYPYGVISLGSYEEESRKKDRRRGTGVESAHLNAVEPQRGGGGGPNASLCRSCEYCRSVDIDGKVDCDLFSGGREKAYCRGYKAKDNKV